MTLQKGSKGAAVAVLQATLNKVGYNVNPDGDFGSKTELAVVMFQKSNHLVADGVAGPLTQAALAVAVSGVSVIPVNPPSPADERIKGVDVYRDDGVQDWNEVRADGNFFAYMQATQGLRPVDTKYGVWKDQAAKAGVIPGPYHFIRFDHDLNRQMKLFTDRVKEVGLDKEDLPPCLDFEYYPETRKKLKTDPDIAKFCLEWIEDKLVRLPTIYLSSSLPGEIGMPEYFAKYPLWVANYNKTFVTPKPWARWDFWQYSDKGKVRGIHNPDGTDVNYFNGTLLDLKNFISKT